MKGKERHFSSYSLQLEKCFSNSITYQTKSTFLDIIRKNNKFLKYWMFYQVSVHKTYGNYTKSYGNKINYRKHNKEEKQNFDTEQASRDKRI